MKDGSLNASPHQVRGSMTCWRITKAPRGRHTEYKFGSLKNQSTRQQYLALTLSGANSSTNTHKVYDRPKNLISGFLDGLEILAFELQQP